MFDDSDTMRRFLLQFHIVGTHNCCCAFGATDAPMITTVNSLNTQVTHNSPAQYTALPRANMHLTIRTGLAVLFE